MSLMNVTTSIHKAISAIVIYPLLLVSYCFPPLLILTIPLLFVLSIPLLILGIALDLIGLIATGIATGILVLGAAALVGAGVMFNGLKNFGTKVVTGISEFIKNGWSKISNSISKLFSRSADHTKDKQTYRDEDVVMIPSPEQQLVISEQVLPGLSPHWDNLRQNNQETVVPNESVPYAEVIPMGSRQTKSPLLRSGL